MLSNNSKKVKKTNENTKENIILDVFSVYHLFVIVMGFLNGTDLIKAVNACLIHKLVQDNRNMSYFYYVNKQIIRERKLFIWNKQIGWPGGLIKIIISEYSGVSYVEWWLKEYIFMYKYCKHFNMYNRFNTIKELLNQKVESFRQEGKVYVTNKIRLINYSIKKLNVEVIYCLLKNNVDINFKEDEDGLSNTPLHYLASNLSEIIKKTKTYRYKTREFCFNRKFCVYDIFKTFLERMSIHFINYKNKKKGETALDILYTKRTKECKYKSKRKSGIGINYNLFIKLLRNKDGRSNYYDINGVKVGRGKGDINI